MECGDVTPKGCMLVIEDPLTVVFSRRDVIPAVLELSAQGPSHGRRMSNGQMWNVET
ncbi:hypothetical protein SBV1_820031 [Verrucomicrobia bacterium]|nr:hypothetical protein SBV1_820031 [Verrucomicrobiota bacterium]